MRSRFGTYLIGVSVGVITLAVLGCEALEIIEDTGERVSILCIVDVQVYGENNAPLAGQTVTWQSYKETTTGAHIGHSEFGPNTAVTNEEGRCTIGYITYNLGGDAGALARFVVGVIEDGREVSDNAIFYPSDGDPEQSTTTVVKHAVVYFN